MSNILQHTKALEYHAAARHVLGLAAERAVLAGALRPDDAFELQQRARTRMNTADVRLAIELVLQLSAAWKQQRQRTMTQIEGPAA